MPTPETETKKNFCEFADWSWFSFFERNFYEVVAVFNATETDWDIITFDKSPAAALVIVSRGANYVSGFRLSKYASHFKAAKGCLYAVGGRYTGGDDVDDYKLLNERGDFILKLRKQLAN